MSKQITINQWIKVIKIRKNLGNKEAYKYYLSINDSNITYRNFVNLSSRKIKIIDNNNMKTLKRKPGSGFKSTGRTKKRDDSDIPSIIDELNEEEKREIIENWIKDQRDKRNKNSLNSYTKIRQKMKPKILKFHRTTQYKNRVNRKYKYEYLKESVTRIFTESKGIYGSRKIAVILNELGHSILDRTLRNYMFRWNISTLTRRKKKKLEQKNTNVKFKDLVKRNYNPMSNNIIATDVSYIPANVPENHIYLSAAINHKTKMIEAWEISRNNDTALIIKTINNLNRKNFILHSDHGSQYSSNWVLKRLEELNAQTSMARIGNSLDNREIEYFFGCLKGEYLKHLNTSKMNFKEIHNHIKWYINWYNSKRIQKRLNWKTPAYASVNISL